MAAWIAVACAEHVRRGLAGGFMQVSHGKAAPLQRIRPGDGVACYSPSIVFGSRTPYRAFTGIGVVAEGEPYAFDMGGGFQPWRRDMRWDDTRDAPIAPLLRLLGFSAGRSNWGQPLRFGLLAISPEDLRLIAAAMRPAGTVATPAPTSPKTPASPC